MVSKELIDYINNELPINGGWWDEDNRSKFHEASGAMLGYGMSVDLIKKILYDIYTATAEEYELFK